MLIRRIIWFFLTIESIERICVSLGTALCVGVERGASEAYLSSPQLALYPTGVCGGVLSNMEEEEMNRVIKVSVEVVVDHLDSVPALLHEVANLMSAETSNGMLEKEDGDKITWRTR